MENMNDVLQNYMDLDPVLLSFEKGDLTAEDLMLSQQEMQKRIAFEFVLEQVMQASQQLDEAIKRADEENKPKHNVSIPVSFLMSGFDGKPMRVGFEMTQFNQQEITQEMTERMIKDGASRSLSAIEQGFQETGSIEFGSALAQFGSEYGSYKKNDEQYQQVYREVLIGLKDDLIKKAVHYQEMGFGAKHGLDAVQQVKEGFEWAELKAVITEAEAIEFRRDLEDALLEKVPPQNDFDKWLNGMKDLTSVGVGALRVYSLTTGLSSGSILDNAPNLALAFIDDTLKGAVGQGHAQATGMTSAPVFAPSQS